MNKRSDIDKRVQYINALVQGGWQRHAWLLYRYTDASEKFIVSADFENCEIAQNYFMIQPHVVSLNEISHFVWDDRNKPSKGLFKSKKLTAANNINDYRACSLSYVSQKIAIPASGDHLQILDEAAFKMTERYKSIDDLIDVYKDAPIFKGPLMCMNLYKEKYKCVRRLLEEDGISSKKGAGDVRFYIARYLDKNNLG